MMANKGMLFLPRHDNCGWFSVVLVAALALLVAPVAEGWTVDRRTYLGLLQLVQVMEVAPASATATTTATNSRGRSNSHKNGVASSPPPRVLTKPNMPENVDITDRVYMDVRVARTDGSTYVRDDLPDTFENRVLFQRINFGLYGKLAPNHVEKFLSYIVPPPSGGSSTDTANNNDYDSDENPYPSYARSTFSSLDQETGLLMGGNIPSLRRV
jgi:hypothetical protein